MLFLFFALAAFVFWILQALQQDFEITIPINIQYRELPEGYAFIDQPTDKLNILIQDKGSTLLNYRFTNPVSSIEINLSDSKENIIVFDFLRLQSIVSKQLIPTTRLLKITPDSIAIHYSRLEKKRLPVRFFGEIVPATGYMLDKQIRIEPYFIDVYAPASILDTLTSITTENIRMKEVANKIKKNVRLNFPINVSSKTEEVELSINIEEASEKKVEVPITISQLPKGFNIKLFPPKAEVVFRLPLPRFEQVTASDFKVEVFYDDIIDNRNGWIIAKITQSPDFVDFVRLSSSRIDFILEVVNKND